MIWQTLKVFINLLLMNIGWNTFLPLSLDPSDAV